jgi:hypothetical protein
VLVGKLDLAAELLRKLLRCQRRREGIERNLLALGHGRHQSKVIAQRVPLGQRAQPLPAPREKACWVGQSDPRERRCRKRLNLGGI